MNCKDNNKNTHSNCIAQKTCPIQNGYIVPNRGSMQGQCGAVKQEQQGKINCYSNTYDINGGSYVVTNQNYYTNYYNRYNHYYVMDTNYITDCITDYNVYHVIQPANYMQAHNIETYTVIENGCMPVSPCSQYPTTYRNEINVADCQKRYMCQ